jgi:hypothetical protein
MKKINDWFFAGLIAGIIGGMGLIIYNFGLLLLGVPTGTYWKAMGGLFYNKQLLQNWLAQIHGIIDALGVSGANGVLLAWIVKYTGTDYLYTKSLALSAAGAYFLFIVVYPHTGLGKDNPFTPWVALFGHTVFCGLLAGYVLQRIWTVNKQPVEETVRDRPGSVISTLSVVNVPLELEYAESISPVPEFNRELMLVPDYAPKLLAAHILKHRPGRRILHFIKPVKLKGRNKK